MTIEAGATFVSDVTPVRPRNRLLAKMSAQDLALVTAHLEDITLKERQVVEVPNKPITHVYFVETGVVSVVAVNAEDHRIEVGVIGREGMTGSPLVFGDDRAQHSAYMQIGGSGKRIAAPAFAAAMNQSQTLRALVLKSAQAFMIQSAHTALANGRAKLEERLARWLLMAHDRLDSDAVPLTHEFLAVMLGVRRAGVTVALHSFERRGLIATKRGQLTLINRAGIEEVAGSFYGIPEAELKRLMGESL
jgi:CRP-like cAMP-binding protein